MPERIVLHIGPMKTGTSYLQAVLAELRPQLAASGWLYPAGQATDAPPSHQRAVYGLVGARMPWVPATVVAAHDLEGQRLLAATNAWPGTVLLSAEAMAQLSGPAIEDLLRQLGGAQIDVVITARDLSRVILSSWQQALRNGRAATLERFLERLRDARASDGSLGGGARFWGYQRLADVVARWSRAVGRDHVVVVVVPTSPDPAELWRRFRMGIGLPDQIPEVPPVVSRASANVGLTQPEALLLQAVVQRLAEIGVPDRRRRRVVRGIVADVLLPRTERGQPLRLPSHWVATVSAWSAEDVDRVASAGARVVGDLVELRVTETRQELPAGLDRQVAETAAAVLLHDRPWLVEVGRQAIVTRLGRRLRRLLRQVTGVMPKSSPGTAG